MAKEKDKTEEKTEDINEKTFRERLQITLAETQKVWQERNISRRLVINFPGRHKTPILGSIAKKLLEWTGARLDIQFIDLDKR